MKKISWFGALVMALSGLVSPVVAQAPKAAPAAQWYRAGHVTLRIADAARDFNATWQFDRADNGDNRVIRDERRAGVALNATVMTVCDDLALLMQGVAPVPRREMRELDEPVLHLQMLLRLLARAVPEGPAAVMAVKNLELDEAANPLQVQKGQMGRLDFNAPWRVRGRLTREGDALAFELVFNHAGANAQDARSELTLSGRWQRDSAARSFADSTAIADWRVFRVNPVPVTTGGHTRLESMVITTPLRYATLGHLRRHIERAWSPNPKVAAIMECKA